MRPNVLPHSERNAGRAGSRVMLVTNVPSPYRIPLFNELADQLAAHGMTLRVVFGAGGYGRRMWKLDLSECRFDYEVLHSRLLAIGGNIERTMFSYRGLTRSMRAHAPDVIIVGGFSLAAMQVWRYARATGTPYIIWSGSIAERSALRALQRKLLVRSASGFVAYGSRARDYLVRLGASPERVSIGINTVDTRYFRDAVAALRSSEAPLPRFLFVGYLSKRKRVDLILAAAALLARGGYRFALDIVGDGAERVRLQRYTTKLELDDFVTFHGYRQQQEIPSFLARSSCLLLASDYEVWGLCLVEALAAGVPAIATVNAGATTDVIAQRRTGFALDFADTTSVALAMAWIIDHPDEAAAMGRRAQKHIGESVSISRSAEGFVSAVELALPGKGIAALP